MKAIKLFGAIALATAFLVGCNSNPEKISSKLILKQVNQELAANAVDEKYTYLQIGTFECDSPSQREVYAKLDVAGIVKYKVTRYAWWEKSIKEYRQPYKVTRSYGWWTYEDTEYRWVKGPAYDFEDHYVVTVSLTGKGKGLVTEPKELAENRDPDLVEPEVDPASYKWNKKDLSENWEYIPNPFLEPEKEEPAPEETPVETPAEPESEEVYVEETPEPEVDPTVRIDSLKYEAYNKLEFETTEVCLKVGNIKATKARNILVTNENGILKATAEVIIETQNATDAGRILEGFENGRKHLKEVDLIYYLDKGWTLVK